MARPDKGSICLARPCRGHTHDARMWQHALPPEGAWLIALHVRVDLGSLGMQSDDRGAPIDLPTRKPRQSQKNPNPPWSAEQKAAKTAWRRVRICIEPAIGGMKRSHIVVPTLRHRLEHVEDDVIGIWCAITGGNPDTAEKRW